MTYRAAEFFAGIGLVRKALEQADIEVVFANDIEQSKAAMYASNFDSDHFVVGDVRAVRGDDLPDVDLATASFPCTDLSLAGNRAGLAGMQSSMFWEFARVLDELEERRPKTVLLENVPSFLTSHGGADLRRAVERLNVLGYACDLLLVDARWFVPQSRPRLFVVGSTDGLPGPSEPLTEDTLRPRSIVQFMRGNKDLRWRRARLAPPVRKTTSLSDVAERMAEDDPRWWNAERAGRFIESLAPIHRARLDEVRDEQRVATAYRRTRNGRAVWEIRPDQIAGCLRTARGGSSKQAVVDGRGAGVGIRWMTAREYARLQGAPDFSLSGVSEVQAMFGFGDAVCVPAVAWIAQNYLVPLLDLAEACEPVLAA